ncbi:hypothetical protein PTL66_15350, partial [Clostridium perfringens]|nr:hypothetical protein [Clostridium perfringens]
NSQFFESGCRENAANNAMIYMDMIKMIPITARGRFHFIGKVPRSYYKVVVFIVPLQGLLHHLFIIATLYLFYRYSYDI